MRYFSHLSISILFIPWMQLGMGVPRDLNASIAFYNASAAAGNDHAQVALAYLYETGTGVPLNEPAVCCCSLVFLFFR